MDIEKTQQLIAEVCDEIKGLLLGKNKKYGNSAIEPIRIFSKASPLEQIRVRIDDKLNRIQTMGTEVQSDEDTVKDLIGYLILYRVAGMVQQMEESPREPVHQDGACGGCCGNCSDYHS